MRSFALLLLVPLLPLFACRPLNRTEPAPNVEAADPSGTAARGPNGRQDGSGSQDGTPAPPPTTVVTSETLEVVGTTRSYLLAKPISYSSAKTYPLVLALHGDGGSGSSMRASFPIDETSGDAALVAYPSGTYGWNLYDPAATNPDLAFLVALVESLKGRYSIDPQRVFGMGFSSGAFMVNQVACRRPTLFRAIAPQSGGAPSEPRDSTASQWDGGYTRCQDQTLGNGPAVLVIHGQADTEVAPESGGYTANYWAYINGCGAGRAATTPAPCAAQDACPSGKPVVYCAIDNLGHAFWPAARAATWQFFESL